VVESLGAQDLQERRLEDLPRPLAALLEEAEEDLLQLLLGPLGEAALHEPLERVNREIGRRTDTRRIFPNDRALILLAS
jgi:putative transposase